MSKFGSAEKIKLNAFDDLFGENQESGAGTEQIMTVSLSDLQTFIPLKTILSEWLTMKRWRKPQRA